MIKKIISCFFLLLIADCSTKSKVIGTIWLASAPAGIELTQINKQGKTIIPNGRFVTPLGKSIVTAPHPYGLTISPDNTIAVTANSGTNPISISIIRNLLSNHPEVQQVPPTSATDKGVLASVFMGLAISPDNKTVYVAGGQKNKIYLFDLANGAAKGFIDCTSKSEIHDYTDGYIGDLKLSKDGKTIYAVDQIGFRMIIADTDSKTLTQSVPVGRYPFGICLSPDEKKAYVANVGMFQYSYIKDSEKEEAKITPISYPATAYGSKEMVEGIQNDTIKINGLGALNAIEAFSVFAINLEDKNNAKVVAKIKTGHLVGAMIEGIPAVGGSSPNSIVATNDYVFVSNGTNDNISVISIKKDTIINTIALKPDYRVKQFRGVIPFGLAISPDQKRLYVAESGINAIGVINIKDQKVVGHIPAGWFPSKIEVTKDGKHLIIANAKGYGSGPNGGRSFQVGSEGSYIGSLMKGTVQVAAIPSDDRLEEITQQVISNNFKFTKATDTIYNSRKDNPIPLYPGEKESPIKHIVFISKENRTYDEIFGQIKKGNGDASLARYGENADFVNREKTDSLAAITVMPNHLALARQFGLADNFYVDSDVSADGHRWLVNTYPNEWCETATAASYGGNRDFKSESKAPGIFAMNGAAGAIYPEDYNEAGSMWDHLERNAIRFYNFGFSIMFEPALYEANFKYTGIKQFVNYPMPQPLFTRTSKTYPTYNTSIPDQFRIDQFEKEFDEKWVKGKELMPELITVIIPNDHGAGDNPKAGYPFKESYLADNDLALGRIVEYLSRTPYWKDMLIVVTEDDAQNGVDHIDAHRSVLLLISPWVKREYASHLHYSFGSIFKTFWNVLATPYLNQYDAGATDLSDFFTSTPNYKPYNAVEVDPRVFDPQKALDPFDENFDWKSLKESPEMDNEADMLRESKEQDEYRLENREKKNIQKKNSKNE
ncbi:bifunctional YncE family protein/alkaline phosphatase family protein [Flavobacterium frigoris]|uniref:DNA-binding beta-propeller fold protein YncE n=1 Tax=Flavobacterium frigoris TaxID=229204 RepID=A0A1H9HGX4_FLAFI|nr:bifunctional YncE family protein/alkaline phosphatase family protein [Flavobacterium frigoris]SEQ61512.1 DNA-binding beta-propeller fold protein YncE [Flavobacterium frigoris]